METITMTRNKLEREIAELQEPSNTLPTPTVVVIDESKPSPHGAWFAARYFADNDEARWYPRKLTGEYAFELLEIIINVKGGSAEIYGHSDGVTLYGPVSEEHAPTLEEAIALAYIAWKKK